MFQSDKIVPITEAYKIRNIHEGKAICFTNGCFDVIHIGHVHCLREAKKRGDILIVGLNSDASVKRLKGSNRPINTQEDRAAILAAFEFVDYVIVFDEDTPENLIKELHPNIWVKGGDYNADNLPGSELSKQLNIELVFIPLVPGKSTTEILRQKNRQNNIRE